MIWRPLHRAVSLAFAAFWLVQAATGALSVFRWELDDAGVAGATVPVDYAALGGRIEAIERGGGDVSSVWSSGSAPGRFDIHYQQADVGHVMRVDGAGTVLRDRTEHDRFVGGGVFDTLTSVHTSLLSGDNGAWIVGISGIVLLLNILFGLKLAWAKRGTWHKVLFGRPAGRPAARLYAWHRKVGLWLALPALVAVTAGIGLVFVGGIENILGAETVEPRSAPTSGRPIGPGEAVEVALARFPGSSLSGFYLADAETPWYRVRLRAPGEVPRKWGSTNVFVARSGGAVLSVYDASRPTAARAIVDTLYPLHTGQIGGFLGRIVALAVGLWLLAMILLGLFLWRARRKPVRKG